MTPAYAGTLIQTSSCARFTIRLEPPVEYVRAASSLVEYLDDVIQHIVVLKWKAGTTDAQVDDVFAQAHELVDGIDGVERITLGRNRGEAAHGYTHAFIINLADDALPAYLDHPVRKRYVTEVLGPIEEERIEIEVPGDASDRHTRAANLNWKWGPTRHSASADAAALRWEEKELDP